MSQEQSTQSIDLQPYLAEYLIHEYPSHFTQVNGWANTSFPCENPHVEKLFKKRKRYVLSTNGIYIIEAILVFAQLVRLFLYAIQETHLWCLFTLKTLGFVLCLLSFSAWRKQLWKDEEYYGQALANYSVDEPIDRALSKLFYRKLFFPENSQKKAEPENSQEEADLEGKKVRLKAIIAVVGDWLKNRPSITLLLVATISCYRIESVLGINWSPAGWMASLWSFVLQLIISLISFILHLPFLSRSGSKYIAVKNAEQRIRKTWLFNKMTFWIWFILFFLPALISFILSPEIITYVISILLPFLHSVFPTYNFILIVAFACLLIYLLRKHIAFVLKSIADIFPRSEKTSSEKKDNQNHASNLKWIPFILPAIVILYLAVVLLIAAFNAPGQLNGAYDMICVLCLLGTGLLVYFLLYILSQKDAKATAAEDKTKIDQIIDKINKKTIPDKDFKFLSPKGQMQILNMIQNRDIIINNDEYLNTLSAITSQAHTPLVLDAILDIYRNHDYLGTEKAQSAPKHTETSI